MGPILSDEDSENRSGATSTPDVGFVACIERGVLERQAVLLFESVRMYGGRFRNCEIYALSPRVERPISRWARKRLLDLRVHHIDKILNTECPEYGSANRVAAAAYVEDKYPHEFLVILDSDTLFLREPASILLPADVDVAVRPVDLKGMCTEGVSDPFDAYWRDLCCCCQVDYDCIPWTESFVDRRRIKASYNAGLVIARANLGIMRRWWKYFLASVSCGLKPFTEPRQFRAGVGWVTPEASRMWGSNQAALSLAIWSSTRRLQELPPTYNYPLHLHRQINTSIVSTVFPKLVHVHYHWCLEMADNPLWDADSPLTKEQRAWLAPISAQPRTS